MTQSVQSQIDGTTLFKNKRFLSFWLARLCSTLALQMLLLALAWQMYDLTSNPWDLGLVGLFQFMPALILALPAGQVVDRFNRGMIILICFAVQAFASAALWMASDTLWLSRELILSLSVVLGATRAFQMPAQQAMLPMLVSITAFPRAMAFSAAGIQIAIIVGPALAGFLFAWGAVQVYATSLVFVALSSLSMRWVRFPIAQYSGVAVSWREIFAGVEFVWQKKILLGAISLDLFAVLLGGATALLPIFAKDILQVGAIGLGLLRSAPAVGALLMSLMLTRWPLRQKVGLRLMTSVAVFGCSIVMFSVSSNIGLSLIALALGGAADMVNVVIRQTLVQIETPDHMRGRVSAINTIFIGASNQLGEFESGATAFLWGPVAAAAAGGVGTIAVAIAWCFLFKDLYRRDRLTH
jgi:MFS family permease